MFGMSWQQKTPQFVVVRKGTEDGSNEVHAWVNCFAALSPSRTLSRDFID
jgi:hypothetical protein